MICDMSSDYLQFTIYRGVLLGISKAIIIGEPRHGTVLGKHIHVYVAWPPPYASFRLALLTRALHSYASSAMFNMYAYLDAECDVKSSATLSNRAAYHISSAIVILVVKK